MGKSAFCFCFSRCITTLLEIPNLHVYITKNLLRNNPKKLNLIICYLIFFGKCWFVVCWSCDHPWFFNRQSQLTNSFPGHRVFRCYCCCFAQAEVLSRLLIYFHGKLWLNFVFELFQSHSLHGFIIFLCFIILCSCEIGLYFWLPNSFINAHQFLIFGPSYFPPFILPHMGNNFQLRQKKKCL